MSNDDSEYEEVNPMGMTPAEAVPENNIKNVDDDAFNVDEGSLIKDNEDYNGEDLAMIPIPDERDKPTYEWTKAERRAYLFSKILEYGHADNLPKSQREYGEMFDVVQQTITYDIKRIRDYIAATAGRRVISDTETVKEKVVQDLLDDGELKKAWQVQKEYTEWLFELGKLEREPSKQQIQSVSAQMDVSQDLDDDQKEKIDALVEQMQEDGNNTDSGVIDVKATEVDDE